MVPSRLPMNRSKRPATPSPARSAVPPVAPQALSGWVFALFLGLLLIAYLPCLRGEFLWDDAGHVTRPELRSWAGLLRIWCEPGVTQQYYPLLHSAFWLEHRLWGDATPGYHVVNVVWHAMASYLFVLLLRRLAVPGALFAGLLFALHPVGVESVAWISEQKNTLSTVFYLAAALAWLRFEERRGPRTYAIATLWFIAALLTKTVTATLPAALLVVAWWRKGRLSWREDVQPLLPWLIVGISAGLFTAWFERTGIGAQGADFALSFLERVVLAGRLFWFYLGKLAWPANLTFFYPRWHVDAAEAWQYLFPVAAIALLGGLGWIARRSRARGPLAAILLFAGTLFPVLGFLDVYPFIFSYAADHFQYLASLSLFALAAAGGATAARNLSIARSSRAFQVLGVASVAGLGVMTWRQSWQYQDPITLFRTTIARNPDSWVAHHNLAAELTARGQPAEALPHARRAVELKPDFPEALNNLADNLTHTGAPADAVPLLNRALAMQPRYAQAENNLGIALVKLGRSDEGKSRFRRALALEPGLAEAHYNLGLAEAEQGNFAAAIVHFTETARLRPEHVGAELNWGVALAVSDRVSESIAHFERALVLDPESGPLRHTYARVLLAAGRLDEAVSQLRAALEREPHLPGVQQDLAVALQRLGRTEEARPHALEAGRGR